MSAGLVFVRIQDLVKLPIFPKNLNVLQYLVELSILSKV